MNAWSYTSLPHTFHAVVFNLNRELFISFAVRHWMYANSQTAYKKSVYVIGAHSSALAVHYENTMNFFFLCKLNAFDTHTTI
jgi:hypothetical protein